MPGNGVESSENSPSSNRIVGIADGERLVTASITVTDTAQTPTVEQSPAKMFEQPDIPMHSAGSSKRTLRLNES